jgi:hypothetical protein
LPGRESRSNVLIEVASGLKTRSFNSRREAARLRAVFVFADFFAWKFFAPTKTLRHAYNVPLIALHVEEIHA